jgi:hypothetical protein
MAPARPEPARTVHVFMTPIRSSGRIPEDWSGDQPEADSSPGRSHGTVGETDEIDRRWLLRIYEWALKSEQQLIFFSSRTRLGALGSLTTSGLDRRPRDLHQLQHPFSKRKKKQFQKCGDNA